MTDTAIFAAGCFWGVEAAFRKIPGVVDVVVGYMGGTLENPTYEDVCDGTTGHAEVVEIMYDSGKVSYEELLKTFWSIHDPTQMNRQGQDVGTQYRSVIFYHTLEQQKQAEESKKQLDDSRQYKKPVATAIEPALTFWHAEEYHQRYTEKHGGICR